MPVEEQEYRLLLWHREDFATLRSAFDWFLYQEAALALTHHHLAQLITDIHFLNSTGYLPGLLRFEVPRCLDPPSALHPNRSELYRVVPTAWGSARGLNTSQVYLYDFQTCCHPMVSALISIRGRPFLQPHNPAQGYYLLPRPLLEQEVLLPVYPPFSKVL